MILFCCLIDKRLQVLFEGRSSQWYMQLMQLRKESLKKIQACMYRYVFISIIKNKKCFNLYPFTRKSILCYNQLPHNCPHPLPPTAKMTTDLSTQGGCWEISDQDGRLLGLFHPHLSKLRISGHSQKKNLSNVTKLGRKVDW